jgi:hypothetical protein
MRTVQIFIKAIGVGSVKTQEKDCMTMTDRRRSLRRPTCEPARVIFNYRHVRECKLLDISDEGACIETVSTDVPDKFDLIRDQDSRTCEVRWRHFHRMGVEFDSFFLLVGSIGAAGN